MDKCIKCGATEEVALLCGHRCLYQIPCLTRQVAALKAEKATAAEAFRSCEYVDETEGNVALEMSESGWRSLRRYFGRE